MSLIIRGGRPLQGYINIGGAKNAALPIIAATLLTADECMLENVPDIEDIRNMVRVLHSMGVAARFGVTAGCVFVPRGSTEPTCPSILPAPCAPVS